MLPHHAGGPYGLSYWASAPLASGSRFDALMESLGSHSLPPLSITRPRATTALLLSGLDSLYVSHFLDVEHSQLDFDEME